MRWYLKLFLLLAGIFYTFCGINLYYCYYFKAVDGDGFGLLLIPPIIIEEKVPLTAAPEIAFQSLILGALLLSFLAVLHAWGRNKSKNAN